MGFDPCSRDPASGVRNRPQPLATSVRGRSGSKVAVPMGKVAKNVSFSIFFDVSEDVVMSFCVAGMALCHIRRAWGGMCVHDRRGSKVAVSLGKVTQTCLSQRVRRSGTL